MDAIKILALHGHWLAADAVKQFILVDVPVDEETAAQLGDLQDVAQFSSSVMRLQIFYGLLYVVVEGYIELGCRDERVDRLLGESEYVASLRRFRNAVFHYQEQPISPKLTAFLEVESSEDWTYNLYHAAKAFFEATSPVKEFLDSLQKPMDVG